MKRTPSQAKGGGELRRVRRHTRASAAELKAFLADFKGRGPREMIGLLTTSQLARALGLSTLLVAAALLLLTVIPFLLTPEPSAESPRDDAPTAAAPESPPPTASPEPAPTPDPPADAPSVLGVDEARPAPPDVNPLETRDDDFLDGLD